MPCYVSLTKPSSKKEYDLWIKLGYIGSFEEYLERERNRTIGDKIFINGKLGDHCADCADIGENLCDYPVGNNKTCDRPICETHSHEIGINLHYCETHYGMWKEFKNSGGVSEHLKNVIAIKSEK